ncbi:MAG: TatD family hydrolase [Deltaproteobacteria bacterium]|nr:TatD family hydrolase [Deltaproteobacteria bacterium]
MDITEKKDLKARWGWIDSHAHLDMKDFDPDRGEVLQRAWDQGFAAVITIGIDLESSRQAVALAGAEARVWATVGLHPHEAGGFDSRQVSEIKSLIANEKVLAVGEVGLDFFRNYAPPARQKECFRAMIALAREVSRPLVVHDREAHEDVLNILKEEKAEEVGGIFHCFSGDWPMARRCLDLHFLLSVTGALTYKKGSILEEVVRRAPLESLLLETDAPFLTPHPFRGKRNEPVQLLHTAARMAEIRRMGLEELGRVIYENTCRAFRKKFKSEIRSTKSETNTNFQNSNDQNRNRFEF